MLDIKWLNNNIPRIWNMQQRHSVFLAKSNSQIHLSASKGRTVHWLSVPARVSVDDHSGCCKCHVGNGVAPCGERSESNISLWWWEWEQYNLEVMGLRAISLSGEGSESNISFRWRKWEQYLLSVVREVRRLKILAESHSLTPNKTLRNFSHNPPAHSHVTIRFRYGD